MRHNRKKNRSIFFLTFSSCVFCFSVFSFCCSSALALRCVSSFFFFLFEGWGVVGFISKWEVGPTVYFTCNCEANWVKGNCGKCFLPTCETAIKLFKDGSMQSNGVSINRTE